MCAEHNTCGAFALLLPLYVILLKIYQKYAQYFNTLVRFSRIL